MGLPQINQGISLQLELVSSSNSGHTHTHTKHSTVLIYCTALDQHTANNYKLSLGFVFYCQNEIFGDFEVLYVCSI